MGVLTTENAFRRFATALQVSQRRRRSFGLRGSHLLDLDLEEVLDLDLLGLELEMELELDPPLAMESALESELESALE